MSCAFCGVFLYSNILGPILERSLSTLTCYPLDFCFSSTDGPWIKLKSKIYQTEAIGSGGAGKGGGEWKQVRSKMGKRDIKHSADSLMDMEG